MKNIERIARDWWYGEEIYDEDIDLLVEFAEINALDRIPARLERKKYLRRHEIIDKLQASAIDE